MLVWLGGLAAGIVASVIFEYVFGGVFRAIGRTITTVVVTTGQYVFMVLSLGYWQTLESRNEIVPMLCGFVGFFVWLAVLIGFVNLMRET